MNESKQTLKRVKGFSNNGVVWEGQKDFDKDYLDIKIVDKVVPVGEDKFTIVKQVVETRTPIAEVVAEDASKVGVYNILKQFEKTGDMSLIPVDKGDCNVDFVGAPTNLMEIKKLGVDAEKKFKALPAELVEGQDMISFVNSMSQEKFNSFMKAMAERASKKEVKKDE